MTEVPGVRGRTPEVDRLVEAYDGRTVDLQAIQPYRVSSILLVASLYDSFTLSEGEHLAELLFGAYHNLALSAPPQITRVSTRARALASLEEREYDVVITLANVDDIPLPAFREEARERQPDVPVMLMAYDGQELEPGDPRSPAADRAFLWRGDVRLFLAIIKLIEDASNAAEDANLAGVRTIILVEDSVPFYSTYLPMLFTEVMKQTDLLISDSVNTGQRLLRRRLRPRILLATTYEEGLALYEQFHDNVLCLISDVRFPRAGQMDPTAGLALLRQIRERDPDVPLLLQSSEPTASEAARELRAGFLHKNSPTLLHDFREFMLEQLGFGEFVFRLPDGSEIARATDVPSMLRLLGQVPSEALIYHGSRHHFSNWLMARTEFALASALRKLQVSDFTSVETMRAFLAETFVAIREASRRGQVMDFDVLRYDVDSPFVRVGTGSLGGKGRGLAFIHELLSRGGRVEVDGVRVTVPRSAVVATDVFDDFMEGNGISSYVLREENDSVILERTLAAKLPKRVKEELEAYLAKARYPLAVRSSSLLEDSRHLPAAGIYPTHMLANQDDDPRHRLENLLQAIKHIYASTFFKAAKSYLRGTPGRVEDEKMAIVIQELVGRSVGPYVFPHMSGVARTHNYYPVGRMTPEEGVAVAAIGLGRTVVDGGKAVRFSPAHPEWLPQFSSVDDILDNAQREIWALDVRRPIKFTEAFGPDNLVRVPIGEALEPAVQSMLCSTFVPQNDAIYDGTGRGGIPLGTFAPILKGGRFPLTKAIRLLLELGRVGMSGPVEIEFAANLPDPSDAEDSGSFAFLQIRPQVIHAESDSALEHVRQEDVLVGPCRALGAGRESGIMDVVWVHPDRFDRSRTGDVAAEIGRVNARLLDAGRAYLLIGPGRWGTADRWLGIPVSWDRISGARAIVECPLAGTTVEPSDGAHFFHNITSRGMAYFVVADELDAGVDWHWLESRSDTGDGVVLHSVLEAPVEILVDGRDGRGAILKGDRMRYTGRP